MCGVAGMLTAQADGEAVVARMTASLAHRGPDDQAVWAEPGVVLGHRRLAIIDLSPTGQQPMVSASGRFVLVYNGEIYNFEALRAELSAQGISFRGPSDSEVLLEALDHWGHERTLRRLDGIFAFAVFDRQDRSLTLARDHLGVKPLYWMHTERRFAFASEPKAFRAIPDWDAALSPGAVNAFLRFGNVPAPASIFADVQKLEPGTWLQVNADGTRHGARYWDACEVAAQGLADPLRDDPDRLVEQLDARIGASVASQMVSDVPLGAFLSGGIDSSVVVAMMQKHAATPVETFSIGFEDADYDEAGSADAVARHLGTRHTGLIATPQMLLDLVETMPQVYCEPFGDASQLPTLLVSKLARQTVTVALSGDGGDELFAGYNRHVWAQRIGSQPLLARRFARTALQYLSPSIVERLARHLPDRTRPRQIGVKMAKLRRALEATDAIDLHRRLISATDAPETLLRQDVAVRVPDPYARFAHDALPADPAAASQLLDTAIYLPNDVLTKVDRASMATSLEVRVPLLAPDLFAFAWRLPSHVKLRDGTGKWILREVLYRYVPKALVDRPKSGFSVPIGDWLRGPLRSYAEDLLSPTALADDDLLDPAAVQAVLARHMGGQDETALLWNVIMLQAWRRHWSASVADDRTAPSVAA